MTAVTRAPLAGLRIRRKNDEKKCFRSINSVLTHAIWRSSSENVIGLYVGCQAALEIGHLDPDAAPSRAKTSRTQARTVAIFGTTNIQEVVDRAKKAGATMIEKVFSEGNDTLYYIGDPDECGWVLGDRPDVEG